MYPDSHHEGQLLNFSRLRALTRRSALYLMTVVPQLAPAVSFISIRSRGDPKSRAKCRYGETGSGSLESPADDFSVRVVDGRFYLFCAINCTFLAS